MACWRSKRCMSWQLLLRSSCVQLTRGTWLDDFTAAGTTAALLLCPCESRLTVRRWRRLRPLLRLLCGTAAARLAAGLELEGRGGAKAERVARLVAGLLVGDFLPALFFFRAVVVIATSIDTPQKARPVFRRHEGHDLLRHVHLVLFGGDRAVKDGLFFNQTAIQAVARVQLVRLVFAAEDVVGGGSGNGCHGDVAVVPALLGVANGA